VPAILGFLAVLGGALLQFDLGVINRPVAMTSNDSKPDQLELVRNCGFIIPEIIVTSDHAALSAFCAMQGKVN